MVRQRLIAEENVFENFGKVQFVHNIIHILDHRLFRKGHGMRD
jgi:hypothetical protein